MCGAQGAFIATQNIPFFNEANLEFLKKGCDAGLDISINKGRETGRRTEVHIHTHGLRIDFT